ncbi:hypothetical protein MTQ01_01265 [Streptomyces sp. XM4193]|uniref:hypothetical protein n=1 Tax=Streptomyces sp. XM4193 TaxID=2929782 RepID=UPI001FF8521A|nr:hypothetical protein [Streptomyces sp. XM4193]MCK1794677.1 hypothetical protein [Streptomyces sp. XM4193]
MNIAGDRTRRAKPAFAARSRLAFAALLATLLGLGVAPQTAHAAQTALAATASAAPAAAELHLGHDENRTPDRAPNRAQDRDRTGQERSERQSEQLRHSPVATTVPGTLPYAPREQHGPGGPGGLLPPAAHQHRPAQAGVAAEDVPALLPGSAPGALPDVRGPPGAPGH